MISNSTGSKKLAAAALLFLALSAQYVSAMDLPSFRDLAATQTLTSPRGSELEKALKGANCEVLVIGGRGPVEMTTAGGGRLRLGSAGDIAYAICPGNQAVVAFSTGQAVNMIGDKLRSVSSELMVAGEQDAEGFTFGEPVTVAEAPLRYAVTWRNEKGRQYAIIRFNTVSIEESKAALIPLAHVLDAQIP